MITSAGAMRSGCGISGPVTKNERFGAQRVSGVPHTRHLVGLLLNDSSPKGLQLLSILGCHTGDGEVISGISLASPPWSSRGHCQFFFFFVMTACSEAR